MEVDVDPRLCEANGVCVGLAPEVFALDEEEALRVRQPVTAAQVERVSKAVQRCPKGALRVVAGDDEEGVEVKNNKF